MREMRERIAEVAYEAEEQQRAKEKGEPGVWIPWEQQTSRREQRVFYAVADAILALIAEARRPVEEEWDAVAKVLEATTSLVGELTVENNSLRADLSETRKALAQRIERGDNLQAQLAAAQQAREQAEGLVGRMREALRKYGRHIYSTDEGVPCGRIAFDTWTRREPPERNCTCGLFAAHDAALASTPERADRICETHRRPVAAAPEMYDFIRELAKDVTIALVILGMPTRDDHQAQVQSRARALLAKIDKETPHAS